jgi:hypothetical protein
VKMGDDNRPRRTHGGGVAAVRRSTTQLGTAYHEQLDALTSQLGHMCGLAGVSAGCM